MFPLAILVLAAVVFVSRATMHDENVTETIDMPNDTFKGAVLYMQRAKGLLPELQAKIVEWDLPFDIMVAPGGGLRTNPAEQLLYYQQGNSKAKTLAETPHGRGAAVDMWPVTFNPSIDLKAQPVAFEQFKQMRQWALDKGLKLIGSVDESWDYPHWELPNWTRYPYPPRSTQAVS